MTESSERPPAPIIASAVYDTDASGIVVTGGTTQSGSVTVYDGDTPVVTTTTVMDTSPDAPFPFTFRAVFAFPALTPGDHMVSACVTTGPDNLTSEWATPETVTVPDHT